MKKLMTIGLAAAMMFAMAGQASATALETSGEIRARGWYVNNYIASGRGTDWFDQRLRLNLVWPVAENVKVNVRADILEGFWGENSETTVNSFDPATGKVIPTTTGTPAKPQIAFDHVNMQFLWPGTPLTFTVGRQDVSWGTGMYAKSDNRDRFKVVAKFAPELSVIFAYDKSKEMFGAEGTNNLEDARAWTLAAAGAAAGWNYGVLTLYSIDETNPVGAKTRIGLDATASGKAGPVDLKVEVAYVTGKDELGVAGDVDVSGIGAYVSAAMPAGPVTVTLEGAYAGGNDPTTKKNEGGFRFDYQSSFWSIILYNNLDYPGYLGSESGNAVTSDYANDFGVTNAMAAKASVAWVPMKGFTLIGAAVYSQAIEDVRVGTTLIKADPLGIEFDVVAVYNITDNVYFLGGFGYLVAGDFFGDVDDPMGVMGSLNVKF